MTIGYLLHRVLLRFKQEVFYQDLSTVAKVGNHLWLGCDETNSIERLTQTEHWMFGEHESFKLADLLDGFHDDEGEVDIEGLDCSDDYLWVVGSHSTKRKKVKNGDAERLKTVKSEPNRYLLARIPLVDGTLHQADGALKSAYLERNEDGNVLMTALKQDEYLAPFLVTPEDANAQPGKDNGLDIEGVVVRGNKLLIGLRGPVLRGMAILMELKVEETEAKLLTLKLNKQDQFYKLHFLDLDGLGIRELCRCKDDVLVLAGPTMDLDGTLRLFRLKNPFHLSHNSFTNQQDGDLVPLFDIPFGRGADRAEGITLFPSLDQENSILVVYDSPAPERIIEESNVLADVFTLK